MRTSRRKSRRPTPKLGPTPKPALMPRLPRRAFSSGLQGGHAEIEIPTRFFCARGFCRLMGPPRDPRAMRRKTGATRKATKREHLEVHGLASGNAKSIFDWRRAKRQWEIGVPGERPSYSVTAIWRLAPWRRGP